MILLEYKQKLLSPFVTKKKKKKILESLNFFSDDIFVVQDMKEFLSSDKSGKAFKLLFDINYEGLKEFYKSVVSRDISFLKTIPSQFVTMEFFENFDFYEFDLFNIFCSDLDEKIKDVIYLKNQNKISIELYSKFNYSNCLQDNMYGKIKEIAFNKFSSINDISISDLEKVYCNPNISVEIKGKLFEIQKQNIERCLLRELQDNKFGNSRNVVNIIFNKNMFINIINMGIEKCTNIPVLESSTNYNYFSQWEDKIFTNPNVSSDVKEILFNMKKNEIKTILEDYNTNLLVSRSYDNMYAKILDLVIDIIENERRDNIDELLKKDFFSKELKERLFEIKVKEIIKPFPENFFVGLIDSNISFEENYNLIQEKVTENIIINFKKADASQQKEFINLIKIIAFNYKVIFFNRVFGLDDENSRLVTLLFNYCEDDISIFINNVQNTKQLLSSNKVELEDFLKFYRGNISIFISNVEKIKYFFNAIDVDINKFIQYSLNNSYDWLKDVIAIVDSNQTKNFANVKMFFLSKFYDSNLSDNRVIDNLNSLIKNYNRYPELLLSISNNSKQLTESERQQVEFLLSRNETLSGENKPISIKDCTSIGDRFKAKCNKMLENIEKMDFNTLRESISLILFNDTIGNMKGKLVKYGNTEELIKLKFNNRYNNLIDDISIMEVLTTMVEELINCNDIVRLKLIARNVLEKYEMACKVSLIFSNYDEKMRKLYECEANINLTKINDTTHKKVFNEEKSREYGVQFFDFSDKNYILLAHNISPRETVEQIVNGNALEGRNTICLSAVSYRNQVYYNYHETSSVIFGYDEIPKGNFIASSISNMASNGSFVKNSTEGGNLSRKQRGILEISSAVKGNNSEILCFRDGLKPKYIILPNGRNPSITEIEIAKKYGLKFALTQNVREKIDNPIIIAEDIIKKSERRNEDLITLKHMRDNLLNVSTMTKPRKIAVFTDSHGLFEPTLAILEDARKNGIDEIYSLGDNIGTGPNPGEVLDLLDKYNVKSIAGNHELYITEGVNAFREHLKNAYLEAEKNASWTKNQLTVEQKNKISLYPKIRELLVGGKKILLCHSIQDLNNGKLIVTPEDYSKIFQGHLHFKNNKDNIQTLRGTGIGYSGNNDRDKAYYIVITENPNGGYEIEEKSVSFDALNLEHNIGLSNLSEEDKMKISDWTQGRSR